MKDEWAVAARVCRRSRAGRGSAPSFAPTASEATLWRALSGSKLGVGFRRQLVIGNFIVDFACPKCRLVVEVDGPATNRRELHDAGRHRALGELGSSGLRAPAHQVMADLSSVLRAIRGALRRAEDFPS